MAAGGAIGFFGGVRREGSSIFFGSCFSCHYVFALAYDYYFLICLFYNVLVLCFFCSIRFSTFYVFVLLFFPLAWMGDDLLDLFPRPV